jgi:hypothetical protein
MNSYELSRQWFDFAFENPHKINPHHTAIYFFAIERCNRLGWKKIFGLPTSMVLEAIGMKSYGSYKKYFDDLVILGFIKVHEYSKNQHSSNIIELTLNVKAGIKALDKALIGHAIKQDESTSESTSESIDSINKQLNKEQLNKEQLNNITTEPIPPFDEFLEYAIEKKPKVCPIELKLKYEAWKENGWKDGHDKTINKWRSKLLQTLPYINDKSFSSPNGPSIPSYRF